MNTPVHPHSSAGPNKGGLVVTNTKHTPKSCSCTQCTEGKHCSGGNFMMKHKERAFRHDSKIQLQQLGDDGDVVLTAGPIGNYFD
jgi:hypothetical protein